MTTNHIDQLAEWFANGESGHASKGDTIIVQEASGYEVYEAAVDGLAVGNERILARAPKPKPAWHDAVAVLASTSHFGLRRVFVKDVDGIWNDALSGRGSFDGNLLDVTPLIEAKVTDEMVTRAHAGMLRRGLGDYSDRVLASIIASALGLETE